MKHIAAVLTLLACLITPAAAQVPPPVPALPDTSRIATFSVSGTTCACSLGFQLYGDGADVDNWIQVFIGTTPVLSTDPTFGWVITSPTGSIGAIPRPITDAVLTFNSVQTGQVTIVSAQRPRRLSEFQENRGVPARDFNQVFNTLFAEGREHWDRLNRTIEGQPGETLNLLPPAASRQGKVLLFDGSGNPGVTASNIGLGNVLGPVSATNGDFSCFNGTSGTLLVDCGAPTVHGVIVGQGAGIAVHAITPGTTGLSFVSNGAAADPGYQALTSAGIAAATITSTQIATNTVANSNLTQAGANTVKGNWTGGTANIADNTMPSCVDSGGNHLNYVNGTGITCGSSANAGAVRSYLAGNTLSGGGSQTLTITAGQETSDDQTTSMVLGSTYTKTFGAWTVGSGNGGLDTGSIAANTWYHIFIIERTDTQVVDVAISLSATIVTVGGNIPAAYNKQRYIGSIKTDATPNILSFTQNGDEFIWAVSPNDINTSTLASANRTLFTLSVPTGVKVNALIRALSTTASQGIIFTSPDETDQAVSGSGAGADLFMGTNAGTAGRFNVRTNTSAQIAARGLSGASTLLQAATYGWVDTRGRFN